MSLLKHQLNTTTKVFVMKPFTKSIRDKGWTMKAVAARWGISPRWLSQIAANPSQRDLDAAAGLPDLRKKQTKEGDEDESTDL